MSKKPPIFQVRINPDLGAKVEELRERYEARVSKAAFVELLITRGIGVTEPKQRICDLADNSESTFKK